MKKMIRTAGLALLCAIAFTGCFKSSEPDIVIVLDESDMIGTWRISSSPVPYFYISFTEPGNFYTYNSNFENQKGTFAFEDNKLVFYFDEDGKTAREAYSYGLLDGALTLYDGNTPIMSLRQEDEDVFFGNWRESDTSYYGFYPNGNVLHFIPDSYDPTRMTVDDMLSYKMDEQKRFTFKDVEYTLAYNGGEELTLTPLQGGSPWTLTRP